MKRGDTLLPLHFTAGVCLSKGPSKPTGRDSVEQYSSYSVVDANLLEEYINILRRNTEDLLVAKDEAGLELTVWKALSICSFLVNGMQDKTKQDDV
jgi:hypothetical protein